MFALYILKSVGETTPPCGISVLMSLFEFGDVADGVLFPTFDVVCDAF